MNENKHSETQATAQSDINHSKNSVKNIPLTGVCQNISDSSSYGRGWDGERKYAQQPALENWYSSEFWNELFWYVRALR